MTDADKIRDYALGTCHSELEIAESFGITQDEVEKALGDSDIERCEQCSWWCEQSEITDGKCKDCQEDSDDD